MNVSGATLSLRPGQGPKGDSPPATTTLSFLTEWIASTAALTIDRYQSGDAGRPFAY